MFENWRTRVDAIRTEAHAVYLASRDPRVPWYAKALAICVLGYLFSPIDLIPDFIPVIGYMDDLLIVPAGLWLVIKLIPPEIMDEHRRAARTLAGCNPRSRVGAVAIVGVWILFLVLAMRLLMRVFR